MNECDVCLCWCSPWKAKYSPDARYRLMQRYIGGRTMADLSKYVTITAFRMDGRGDDPTFFPRQVSCYCGCCCGCVTKNVRPVPEKHNFGHTSCDRRGDQCSLPTCQSLLDVLNLTRIFQWSMPSCEALPLRLTSQRTRSVFFSRRRVVEKIDLNLNRFTLFWTGLHRWWSLREQPRLGGA